MITLRPATAEDVLAYHGALPDPQWHLQYYGLVVEEDGEMIAVGLVSLDPCGRFWVWTHCKKPLPATLVHRRTKLMLRCLKEAEINAVHCYADETVPGAERWLHRLGFRPAETDIPGPKQKQVFRCDLTR